MCVLFIKMYHLLLSKLYVGLDKPVLMMWEFKLCGRPFGRKQRYLDNTFLHISDLIEILFFMRLGIIVVICNIVAVKIFTILNLFLHINTKLIAIFSLWCTFTAVNHHIRVVFYIGIETQ